MSDAPEETGSPRFRQPLESPLSLVARVDSILEVCLKVTGMGYGVVAHVTDDRWLACAVRDEIGFNLPAGGQLPVLTTLCHEACRTRGPIAFDHASADPRWRDHSTPRTYKLESYIAVPIMLADGEMFRTLCAIAPDPVPASKPETVQMFALFAQLIAVLGHDLRNPLAAIDGLASLLERKLAGTDLQRFPTEIVRSARRMARLINDVLDFARGRLGGGMQAVRRPADLVPVLGPGRRRIPRPIPAATCRSTSPWPSRSSAIPTASGS